MRFSSGAGTNQHHPPAAASAINTAGNTTTRKRPSQQHTSWGVATQQHISKPPPHCNCPCAHPECQTPPLYYPTWRHNSKGEYTCRRPATSNLARSTTTKGGGNTSPTEPSVATGYTNVLQCIPPLGYQSTSSPYPVTHISSHPTHKINSPGHPPVSVAPPIE